MLASWENILSSHRDNGDRRDALLELGNALEALVNVLYLIRLDRNGPARVLEWVEMAETQTERMEKILERQSSRQVPLG